MDLNEIKIRNLFDKQKGRGEVQNCFPKFRMHIESRFQKPVPNLPFVINLVHSSSASYVHIYDYNFNGLIHFFLPNTLYSYHSMRGLLARSLSLYSAYEVY